LLPLTTISDQKTSPNKLIKLSREKKLSNKKRKKKRSQLMMLMMIFSDNLQQVKKQPQNQKHNLNQLSQRNKSQLPSQ